MANQSGITITRFGLMAPSSSSRRLFVAWNNDETQKYFTSAGKGKIHHYEVMWRYYAFGRWQGGDHITTNEAVASYTTCQDDYKPDEDEATRVAVKVRAVGADNKWFGKWTDELFYYYKNTPPEAPGAPEVTIDDKTLIATLSNIEIDATGIEFSVRECFDNNTTNLITEKFEDNIAAITATDTVKWTIPIEYGSTYQVRCRGYRLVGNAANQEYIEGEWSEWSSVVSAPAKAPVITNITVKTRNSVYISWKLAKSAKQYIVQYVAKSPDITNVGIDKYFEILGLSIQSETIDVKELNLDENASSYGTTIANLSAGAEYYIRVGSSTTGLGSSSSTTKWSSPQSFILGITPNPPTIWSSNKYVGIGEPLKLYWMHNPQDNSVQTSAVMELSLGKYQYDIKGNRIFNPTSTKTYYYEGLYPNGIVSNAYKSDPDEIADQTYIWEIDTSHDDLADGMAIKWRMKTAGVLTDDSGDSIYGDWSEYKIVDIYDKPSVSLQITDNSETVIQSNGNLTSLPFKVNASVYEYDNQRPTGYYINIDAETSYETVDDLGNSISVIKGTTVYSKYVDTNEFSMTETISADSITLENNQTYKVYCSVHMSSGLIAQQSSLFTVSWDEVSYIPLATVYINQDNLSASIRPFVSNDVEDEVLLSVYRREYDGTFTLIQENVDDYTWCNDPHPALDYARYRIVAKSKATGSIEYQDISPVKIGEKSLVIQWNESWIPVDEERSSEFSRYGCLLKLPYNISVSHSNNPEVSFAKYIGRKSPVTYYGTHINEKASWSADIDATDKETLDMIRRLSVWMGDVYVREPSGTGYWANVKIGYSTNPRELTTPISIDVTRVEGGK